MNIEFLDVHATYKLLKGIFERGNELRRVLREISREKWAQ